MIAAIADIVTVILVTATVAFTVGMAVAEITMREIPSWIAFLLTAGIVSWRLLAAMGWFT